MPGKNSANLEQLAYCMLQDKLPNYSKSNFRQNNSVTKELTGMLSALVLYVSSTNYLILYIGKLRQELAYQKNVFL